MLLASVTPPATGELVLEHGAEILWNGNPWRVANCGIDTVTLVDPEGRAQPLRRAAALTLAQHLGIHSSERQMANNLDAIKVFAKESEAPVLLIGTYQLVEFPALSGQLARLVRRVHFPRYDVESVEGRRGFRDVLYFFEKHVPFAENYRLLDEREMFHTRTIGCVGLLKQWLGRALFQALADGRSLVRRSDVERTAPRDGDVRVWLDEATRGEARLREFERNAPRARATSPSPSRPFTRTRISDRVGT